MGPALICRVHHPALATDRPLGGSVSKQQPHNPLHGITLQVIVEDLVARRGWADLASRINIRCFAFDPSIRSSLKFLRKTEWARRKVEQLYLHDHEADGRGVTRDD
jgi:uncharacterized protein (DUF2132 family)